MRKWLIRGFLILLLLIVCGFAGFIYFLRKNYSPEKVKAELETTLAQKTGFKVAIESLEFTWTGDIRLKRICIRNPELESLRCLIAADITSLDLRMLPLLRKRIEIRAAHLEDMTVNLFVEKKKLNGKDAILRSWDLPKKLELATTSGSGAEVRLEALRVSNGLVAHEFPVLPLPPGDSRFNFSYSEGENKKVVVALQYPDGGALKADLKVRSQNFLQSLKRFAQEYQFSDGDTFTGNAECQRCNASVFDRRLGTISGKFTLKGTHNRIALEVERAQLAILSPISGQFTASSKFTILLPSLGLAEGSGNLSATGVTVAYRAFAYDAVTGAQGDIDATVDFHAARAMLHLPQGLAGSAAATGKIGKTGVAGSLRVKGFHFAPAAGFQLASPDFSAGFMNSTLTLANQTFQLNQYVLTVTGNVSPDNLSVTVTSPKLNYEKWSIENFRANVRRIGRVVRLDDATMVFARGRLNATYSRHLDTKQQSLILAAANIKAQDLSAALGLKATVFGDAQLNTSFQFSGDNAEEIRKKLSGSATLRIGRGKIKDSFFQKGILGGPLHKLEEKFSDIEFTSGSAEVTFDGGMMRAKRIFFDADEWNITLRAEADSAWNGKAALDFRFRSTFVENVANPLHLGIEGRKEGDFYELPFGCRGNIISGACYKQNW